MADSPDDRTFEYYVASKAGLVIITLVGKFKDNKELLDQCLKEVAAADGQHCIIYARDVAELPATAYKDLVHFQNVLRTQFGDIKICSLNPAIKTVLLANAVVRQHELTNNLKETVFALVKKPT